MVKTQTEGELLTVLDKVVVINPNTIDITLQSISVLKNSEPQIFSEEEMKEITRR